MAHGIQKRINQLNQRVSQLYERGEYRQAIPLALRIYALARQYVGKDHPDFAAALNNLAVLYDRIGNYPQAERLYRRALAIKRATLGETHPDVAATLNNLAVLYKAMGEYEQAESLYQQAVAIERVVLGDGHPDLATKLNNLAALYKLVGNYAAAEPLFLEALAIWRTTLGEDHPRVAAGLTNLAGLYQARGDHARAEQCFQQALDIQHRTLGPTHPDVLTNQNNMATLYYEMGKYAQAEQLFQLTLSARRTALGERHPDVVTSLNNLAGLYCTMGNYAQAEQLFQQALDIQAAVLGKADPGIAQHLNNLAVLYKLTGEYARAESLLREALDILRQTLGEEHPGVATALVNLAELYRSMGDYMRAEPLYREVLDIQRGALGERHPDVAASMGSMAELYRLMGNFAQARPLQQQALAIRREALGETHPDTATSLSDLALLYLDAGDYKQAEPLYQQALAIQSAALGTGHPNVATTLNNLAELYKSMGDYKRAETLYQQSLAIRREALGESHPDVAADLNNLATLYYAMGDYERAEALYQQSLAIRREALGESHPDVAASLNNLGAVYYATGRYAEVEQLYQQALAVQRVALGETHPNIAASLNNLAELYKSMGNYAQAEPLLQQALDLQSSVLGEEHFVVALIMNNLAALYVATGREIEALSLMKKAGAMSNCMIGQIFSMGSESQRMAYLATLQVETASFLSFVLQHLSNSEAAVQAALDLILRRKAIGAEALAVQRDAILGGRYPPLAPMLRELTTLRQQIARWTLTGTPPQGREEHLRLLEEQTSTKEQLEVQLAHQIPEMDLMQKLQSADRQAVARALPDKAALVEFVRTDIFDFLAIPARGEAQWKDSHYLAFVLVAGKPDEVLLIDLGKADLIDQRIVTFRTSITGENVPLVSQTMMTQAIQIPHSGETEWAADERHLRPASVRRDEEVHIREGRALREMVFDPLLTVLQGRRRLLLAPDGDMARLPFEVLPTDDGEYLLDAYQISYLSTGRDVLRFEATVAGQSALPLVVADPDFDFSRKSHPSSALGESRGKQAGRLDRGTLHFRRLPGTRIEGEQIAALLDARPLLGEKALEARLKEYRSPHILHIATHGFFLPDQGRGPTKDSLELEIIGKAIGRLERFLEQHVENPLLRSGLALAGANTWNQGGVLPPEAEDGLLTAEDVSGLDLLSTELVVLSACETGLGEVHIGEGVFGLRRAFVLAGAKTLVMSLWKVPDQQTQELMVDFYQRILAGQPRVEALRQAQIMLKAKYPHPRYWGAFICQGDPGPLLAQWPRAR